MGKLDKKVEQIEVIEPKEVKPKRVKRVVKHTMLEDVGTDENGCIRFKKGESYELTKKQIDNFLKHKLICQI
jgi:hypothetical protein